MKNAIINKVDYRLFHVIPKNTNDEDYLIDFNCIGGLKFEFYDERYQAYVYLSDYLELIAKSLYEQCNDKLNECIEKANQDKKTVEAGIHYEYNPFDSDKFKFHKYLVDDKSGKYFDINYETCFFGGENVCGRKILLFYVQFGTMPPDMFYAYSRDFELTLPPEIDGMWEKIRTFNKPEVLEIKK